MSAVMTAAQQGKTIYRRLRSCLSSWEPVYGQSHRFNFEDYEYREETCDR